MLIEETNETVAERHWVTEKKKTAELNHLVYFKDVLPQNGRQEMCCAGEEALVCFHRRRKTVDSFQFGIRYGQGDPLKILATGRGKNQQDHQDR